MTKKPHEKHLYSKRYPRRKSQIEIIIKDDTKISKISIFSTIVLVLITAFYAYQTFRLSHISSEQMLLAAEPNIDLESKKFLKLENDKVKFELINLSPIKLKNIRLYSKYHTHLIDINLNEFVLYRGIKTLSPDFEIDRIEGNSKLPVEFDYSRSGITQTNDNTHFTIGIPPNIKSYSIRDINKFFNLTYAEYRIEFQREIDGKEYYRAFYYLVVLPSDLKEARFIRQTKEDIINQNREIAQFVHLSKSVSK